MIKSIEDDETPQPKKNQRMFLESTRNESKVDPSTKGEWASLDMRV